MFRSTPVLRVDDQDEQWVLELPLVWETTAETIVVPPGFRTDLASIPRALHWLIPVNGRHRSAAILHDYLFTIQDRSRAAADRLFLAAMAAAGVRWSQRWAMYLAVRVGGGLVWSSNAEQIVSDRAAFRAAHGLAPFEAMAAIATSSTSLGVAVK